MKRRTYLALLLTLMLSEGIAVFNAAIFSSDSAHADSFESSVGVAFTLNPTVTISITGGTGATNDGLTIANLTPGDVKDSNIITVSATANTPLGYTLGSTVGNSTYNSTELRKDGTSTANKFTNLTSNISSLSNFSDNTWGYSYSTDSGSTWISGDITSTTNTGYNGLPIYTTSSPIKLINSNTAGSSSIQFKIGAKASSTQIAGTYNNIINFIGTGKIVTTEYTINYHDPSGEATSMPSQQQGTESVGTGAVAISSTQPTRANYLFKGWCTSQVADDADCPANDTLIQPGGLLALNPGTSSATATVTKNLYAIWKSSSPSKLYMQNASMADCGETMYDIRDGADYTTAVIADTCWMTQNLRFQGTELKKGESDVTSDITMTYGQLTSGDSYTEPRITTGSTTDYGTYYNYCAASAGEVCNDTTQQDATRSVCPSGWKLPTQAQLNAVPSKDSHFTAAAGLAGYYNGGSLVLAGTGGFWWASTANSATDQYYLYYSSYGDYWGVYNVSKYRGFSVRCVMDKTMQDVGYWESEVGTGGETTAVDRRDGEKYTIARLSDGNLWMTQNLRFQGTDLKVGESDVTSDITMTYGSLTDGDSYTEPRIATGSTTDYGTYYNYCAASAGEVCNDTTQQDATRSVCPAGWKLPTQAQLNTISSNKPSSFSSVLAGIYFGGTLNGAGYYGYWWGSTGYSATLQYGLYYYKGSDYWGVGGVYKYYGYSARCVRAS